MSKPSTRILNPGLDSAPNNNEYSDFPGDRGLPARKADITTVCEPIV
jgi:hypothetical protein